MSILSFQAFCVEYYAKHIGVTGTDAYRMFRESGLMKVLFDDYEDLHGLGWEALMPMFDRRFLMLLLALCRRRFKFVRSYELEVC